MKTVGMIGCIAPASTILYYCEIIAFFRRRIGKDRYPNILLNSIDRKRILGLVEENRLEALREFICEIVDQLVRAGADFGFFASNTFRQHLRSIGGAFEE